MNLSWPWRASRRRLLYLDAQNLSVYRWQGGELHGEGDFTTDPAGTEAEQWRQLLASPEAKAKQRAEAGLAGYRVRPESVQRRTVNGRPALSCVGEFTLNGEANVEYLTWVSGKNALALFFAQTPEPDLAALRARLDPVIDSLTLP